MRRLPHFVLSAVGLTIAGCNSAGRGSTATPDPKAVFDQMTAHYRELLGVRVVATTMQPPAEPLPVEVTVHRKADPVAPEGAPSFTIDCRITNPMQADRARARAWSPLLGAMPDTASLLTHPPFLVMTLLDERMTTEVVEETGRFVYLGRELTTGGDCHRVRFATTEGNAETWIAAGGDPWLMRVAYSHPDGPKAVRTEVEFTGWQPLP